MLVSYSYQKHSQPLEMLPIQISWASMTAFDIWSGSIPTGWLRPKVAKFGTNTIQGQLLWKIYSLVLPETVGYLQNWWKGVACVGQNEVKTLSSQYKVSTQFILNIGEFVSRSETTPAAECQELGSLHYCHCHDSLDNAFVNCMVQQGLRLLKSVTIRGLVFLSITSNAKISEIFTSY